MVQRAFVWGSGGRQLTPEQIAQQREIEAELARGAIDTSPVGHPLQGLARVANAMAGAFRRGQLDRAQSENDAYNTSEYGNLADRIFGSATTSAMPTPDVSREMTATAPTSGQPVTNDIMGDFMAPIREEVKNPYALAAIASTGRAESGYDAGKMNARWSDPSQSGQQGTSGGLMSWRNDRLANLENYAKLAGEDPANISAGTQGRFFLQEDPNLIAQLNNAKSVEEAQSLMDNAWRYAGYNEPSQERARRLGYAQEYLPSFQTTETASLDPSVGMPAAGAANTDWLQYDNAGKIRSQPISPELQKALSFLPEMGVTARVFSGGQPTAAEGGSRTGSTRHDHGNAADVLFFKDGRQLDWANPDDLPVFEEIVKRGRGAGLTGFGAGPGYMQQGSMHVGFGTPGVWGSGGRGANAAEWLRNAYGAPIDQPTGGQQAIASVMPEQETVLNPIRTTAAMNPDAGVQVADASGFMPGGTGQGEMMQRRRLEQALKQKAMRGSGTDQQIAQELAVGGSRQQPVNRTERDALVEAVRALSDPRANSKTQMLAKLLVEQEMRKRQAAQEEQTWRARQEYTRQQQDQDPLRQMQLEKGRLELDQARNAPGEVKVVGNKLVRVGRDGSVTDITPNDVPASGPFRFSGNSVEAQALNGLLDSGQLTPDQAQQIAAGKTITGPNGEIIFMTPQGITARMPNGQMQNMAGGQPADGIDIFAGAPADSGQQQLPVTGTTSGGADNSGLIQLTEPKNTNAQLPAEMGARIGLGDAFLKELPRIRQQIQNGDASGLIDGAALMMGMGEPAKIWRDIETGKEALVRNLTGAGMAQSEAENQAARYQISPTDTAATMLQKLDNLERDLRATREGAINARSGGMGEAPARDDGDAAALQAAREAIAKGANREAVMKRLRDGGINPEGL